MKYSKLKNRCPWCGPTPSDPEFRAKLCKKHQKEIDDYWKDYVEPEGK